MDKCSSCGEVIPPDPNWSDTDAEAEWDRNFPNEPMNGRAMVCDGCYGAIMGFHNHEIK